MSVNRRRAAALLAFLMLPTTALAADISGKWTFHVEFRLGSGDPTFEFKQTGEKLTGTYRGKFGEFPLAGSVKGDQIEFTFSSERGTAKYTGTVVGDAVKGTAKYPFPAGTGHFQGKRVKKPLSDP